MARAKTSKTPKNGNGTKTASVQTVVAPNANVSSADLEQLIRQRAYELYAERGYTPGHEDEDWLVAEQQVLAKHSLYAKHAGQGV